MLFAEQFLGLKEHTPTFSGTLKVKVGSAPAGATSHSRPQLMTYVTTLEVGRDEEEREGRRKGREGRRGEGGRERGDEEGRGGNRYTVGRNGEQGRDEAGQH